MVRPQQHMFSTNPLPLCGAKRLVRVLAQERKVTACDTYTLYIPWILDSAKHRLDGQTSKSSGNQCGVHPGSLAETTGARAPSYSGGVKRDRPSGEPLGRAIGGQIRRTREGFPWVV